MFSPCSARHRKKGAFLAGKAPKEESSKHKAQFKGEITRERFQHDMVLKAAYIVIFSNKNRKQCMLCTIFYK
jgi:hypothetical protein